MLLKNNAATKTMADPKCSTPSISRHTRKPNPTTTPKHHKLKTDKMTRKRKAIMTLKSNLRINRIRENTGREFQAGALSNQQHLPALSDDHALAATSERRARNNKGKRRADSRESMSHRLSMHEPNYEDNPMSDQQQLVQASTSSHMQYPSPNISRDGHSGGFFERSRDTSVNGGNFTQAHGDYIMIQVNPPREKIYDTQQHPHPPPLLPSPPSQIQNHESTLPPTQSIQSGRSSQFPSMAAHEADPTLTSSTTIFSSDNSNKIYERHLALKNRGFPLWIPEPSRTLPMSYRRKGVNIGDVGIITPSGSFLFLFNICLPSNDPINPPTLPDGFVPIQIDSTRDIREDCEFKPESYLTSTAIEKTDNNPSFRGLSFSVSAAEGAILTFPDGAVSRDLVNIRRFRDYAKANVKNWYRYINGKDRGCEAKNGEVRLVTGCVKATSWGMAAIATASMTQHKVHHLKYRSVDDFVATTAPIPLYKWECTGFAEARVGPDLAEIEDLKKDDRSGVAVGGKYWNQCLFMHTLNISLNDDSFKTISRELEESARVEKSQQFQNQGGSSSPASTPNTSAYVDSAGRQQGTNLVTQTRSASESLGSAVEILAVGNVGKDSVTMTRSQSVPISHPADVLNKILLQKVPNCQVVITQDEDWCSVIKESDETMPSPSEIAERVLATHRVREEDGTVFLERKEQPLALCSQVPSEQPITNNADLQRPMVGSSGLTVANFTPSVLGVSEFAWRPPYADSLIASATLDWHVDNVLDSTFGVSAIDDTIWETQFRSTNIGQAAIRNDYSFSVQNSLTKEWIKDQWPMVILGSSSDLMDIESSTIVQFHTIHSRQPREIVGSQATREASAKRRRSVARYTCDYCDQTFTRNHNRLSHMKAHLGTARTQCAMCGRHLAKTSLARHLKKNCHGNEHKLKVKDKDKVEDSDKGEDNELHAHWTSMFRASSVGSVTGQFQLPKPVPHVNHTLLLGYDQSGVGVKGWGQELARSQD